MSPKVNSEIAVIGIDIGKNSFHLVGQDRRGSIVLRQKWSRGQVEARLANVRPCLIGMKACVGAHHLSRKLQALGHDARLMPAKYVRPYSKGEKNDYRDAEAIGHRTYVVVPRSLDQVNLLVETISRMFAFQRSVLLAHSARNRQTFELFL